MIACPLPNSLDPLIQHAKDMGMGFNANTEVMRAFMMVNRNLEAGAEPVIPTIEEFDEIMEMTNQWTAANKNVVETNAYNGFAPSIGAFHEYQYLKKPLTLDLATQEQLKANSTLSNFANTLSANLNVPYQFITAEEAKELTSGVNVWKGQPGFFLGDTVYLIPELVTEKTVFHEFAHPLVRAIRINNPKLFANLVSQLMATSKGVELMQAAALGYPEDLDPNDPVIMEEALVMSLTKSATDREDSAFNKFIKNLLFALRQILRKVFGEVGEKVKVDKLDANTTIDQLADMLVLNQFEINPSEISREDLAAYLTDVNTYVDTMKNFSKNDLQATTNLFFEMIKKQIRLLKKNEDYKGLEAILKDAFDRPDLKEIYTNLAPYQNITIFLKNEASRIENDAEFARQHIEALIQSLLRTKYMIQRLNASLLKISKEPNDPNNIATVFYYNNVINYWSNFVGEFQKTLTENVKRGELDEDSPIFELVSSIMGQVQNAEKYTGTIYKEGVSQILAETLEPMQQNIDDRFNRELERLTKKNAPQYVIDDLMYDYYGMKGDLLKDYLALKEKVDKGEKLTAAESKNWEVLKRESFIKGAYLNKEKMDYLLTGKLGDAHALNSFLEGYMYNQDPVIFGFATFVKNKMTDVFTNMQAKGNAFLKDVKPLLDKAGYNQGNPAEFGRRATFLDSRGTRNDLNVFEEQQVYSFLNPWKNYRLEMDKLNYEIEEATSLALQTGNDEGVIALKLKKQKFEREYFKMPFKQGYYDRYDIFKRGENDIVGEKAEGLRNELLARIQMLTTGINKQSDAERSDAKDDLDTLWREYRQLHSNYTVTGQLKDEEGIAIATRLREFRNASRDLYTDKLLPDLFRHSLAAYEQYLIDQNYAKGSLPYLKLRKVWLDKNTRIKISDKFYEDRQKILDAIKEIMDKLPKDIRVDADISELNEKLLQLMNPYRDEDMQPEGTAMDIGNIKEIKKVQNLIEIAKQNLPKATGLTSIEHAEVSAYFAKLKEGIKPTAAERSRVNELLAKKTRDGLSSEDKKTLYEKYDELAEIQESLPTDYYLDVMNNYMSLVDLEYVKDNFGFKDIDISTAKDVLTEDFYNNVISSNPEFKDWFDANHIMRKAFNKEGEEYIKIERVKAWSVVRPKDPSYLELHEFVNSDGVLETIPAIPNMTYYKREVKDEYINPEITLLEALEMGDITLATVDAKGQPLPRLDVADKRFINEDYFKIKESDPALFAAVNALMKWHLTFQKGNPAPSRLGLDIPRFMKEGHESRLTTFSVEGRVENPISSWVKRMRAFFTAPAPDDYDRGFNYKDQEMLVKGDLFDDQFAGIPVTGLSKLDHKDVSLDLTQGILRYGLSTEKQRALIAMNPVARALQHVVRDNTPRAVVDVAELNKRMQSNNSISKAYHTIKAIRKGEISVREKAINNFIEREFEGKLNTGVLGADKDNKFIHKFVNNIMKTSAFGYFALNLPSSIKNSMDLRRQSLLQAAGGKYFNHVNYSKGVLWSNKVTWEISAEIYKFGPKSHDTQLVELFDAYQGRFEDKFAEHGSRSFSKDALGSLSWMTSFRKWMELNSNLSIFGAMMYHEKSVDRVVDGKKMRISYMDAWETVDGQIRLKEGVDPAWGIGGVKFKAFKNRVHGVTNNLAGSFAKFEYSEADRYIAFRFATAFKRWFLRMFMNRWQHRGSIWKGTTRSRYDAAVGDTAMGFHLEALRAVFKILKTKGNYVNFVKDSEKAAIMSTIMDVFYVMLLHMAITMLFDFDEDDEDKFAKLREKSGPLPFFGVAEGQDEFKLGGWLSNHALLLSMQLKNESLQWLPIPGYGFQNYMDMLNMKSVAMTNTFDNFKKISIGLIDHAGHNLFGTDDSKAYFDQKEGPYEWMQEGGSKVMTYTGRVFGVTGKDIDPALGVTSLVKGQNWR